MDTLVRVIKSILMAPFILYLYDLIAVSFNLIVPINLFSIVVVGFLGMPGLITILLLLIIV